MLIDWDTVKSYCPSITGIIHVGAYTGEETRYYGATPTKWVEASKSLYEALNAPDKHWFAATNYNGWAYLNVMEFEPANSLLKPNLNKRRKDVRIVDVQKVPARRIDTIQEPGYNFLNLDVQGVELQVLEGTDLTQIDYIYTEVHRVETYKGCTQIEQLDEYLSDYLRVETKWTKRGWGDALYIPNDLF